MGKALEVDELWVNRIIKSLDGIEYGTVQIVVHDGRIVQIERTEKNRFVAESSPVAYTADADRKRENKS